MGNTEGIRKHWKSETSKQKGLKKVKFPRVFISYRRAHSGWAKALQLELKRLGYPDDHVFFDLDRESGLEVGPFQKQLQQQLARAEVLLALITDAPSGPKSDWRFQFSSTETIQQSQKRKLIDYCGVEVSEALSAGTLVVPIYPGKHGSMWIGAQLKLLSGTSCASLQNLNAYPLHDDQFTAGVEVLHRHICNGLLNGTKGQRATEETKRREHVSVQTIPLPTKIDLALAEADVEPDQTFRLICRFKARVTSQGIASAACSSSERQTVQRCFVASRRRQRDKDVCLGTSIRSVKSHQREIIRCYKKKCTGVSQTDDLQ